MTNDPRAISAPQSAVGISIAYGLTGSALARWNEAHQSILAMFPWLQSREYELGFNRVRLWSHYLPDAAVYESQSGERWFLVGSPANRCTWETLTGLASTGNGRPAALEGRWVLLHLEADGQRWHLFNDWAGATPMYFATFAHGGVMSSLEPVVTKVAELEHRHLSKRGLVELLLLGHYLGTDTLYEPMQVAPPDSRGTWWHGKLQRTSQCWSVRPSETPQLNRERLIEELHQLTTQSITQSLSTDENAPVLLTLSSGMDSRLIACVAAETGLTIEAYTYGPLGWTEPHYGRKIAKSLGISWHRVPVGVDYLKDYTGDWLQWFGASLHTHGMYQFPFLQRIQNKRGVLPNGFYGNNMAGGDHPNDCLFQPGKGLLDRYCGYGTYWDQESLVALLDFDPRPHFDEMEALLQDQVRLVKDWPQYQQMNCLDMWNRQARYTSYQPTMYSYYGLERSPFMNRDYARFCLSLPPELLRKRKLQIEMLEKYWPKQFAIGGTSMPLSGLKRKWHGLRYRVAERLPWRIRPIMGVTGVFRMGLDCVSHSKRHAFPCISAAPADVTPLRGKPILEAVRSAIGGSGKDLLRVLAVQPVIYRLCESSNTWSVMSDQHGG